MTSANSLAYTASDQLDSAARQAVKDASNQILTNFFLSFLLFYFILFFFKKKVTCSTK